MNVTLSKEELLSILSKQFGYNVTKYVISKSPDPEALETKVLEGLKPLVKNQVNYLELRANRISAIKKLREIVCDLGLAEAMWAIDNWEKWIAFVKKNNRTPETLPGQSWRGENLQLI